MSFGYLFIIFTAYPIFQLVDTERSDSQNLLRDVQWEPYPQNISHECRQIALASLPNDYYNKIGTEKMQNSSWPASFFQNTLGCQIGWNSDMTVPEKAETASILKCSSKVIDGTIRLQQRTNDTCQGKAGDGNLEGALKNCCKDHSARYCTRAYQVRKFNGGTPSKGDKRVCLEQKNGKSLVLMARTFNNSSPYWEYFARNIAAYIIGACQELVKVSGKVCPVYYMVEGYQHQLLLRENLSYVLLNAVNPYFEQIWPLIRDYPVNSKWLIISEFDYLSPHLDSNDSNVPVTLPELYDEHKEMSLCMRDVYKTFVTTEYAFRCKGVVSLHVDLKKRVNNCCENGGGYACVVENIMKEFRASKHAISTGCDTTAITELYSAEPDSFLVPFVPQLCGHCFCEGQLSVLWDNPKVIVTNTTIRDLFMDLSLGRLQELHDNVLDSLKDSPIYAFKSHDRTTVLTSIGERRPLLTCSKPDDSAHV